MFNINSLDENLQAQQIIAPMWNRISDISDLRNISK